MAMNPKLKTVLMGIRTANFTNDELDYIVQELKAARGSIAMDVRSQLKLGTRVSWETRKRGYPPVLFGTVEAIKPKYVHIRTTGGGWRVPANMLKIEA